MSSASDVEVEDGPIEMMSGSGAGQAYISMPPSGTGGDKGMYRRRGIPCRDLLCVIGLSVLVCLAIVAAALGIAGYAYARTNAYTAGHHRDALTSLQLTDAISEQTLLATKLLMQGESPGGLTLNAELAQANGTDLRAWCGPVRDTLELPGKWNPGDTTVMPEKLAEALHECATHNTVRLWSEGPAVVIGLQPSPQDVPVVQCPTGCRGGLMIVWIGLPERLGGSWAPPTGGIAAAAHQTLGPANSMKTVVSNGDNGGEAAPEQRSAIVELRAWGNQGVSLVVRQREPGMGSDTAWPWGVYAQRPSIPWDWDSVSIEQAAFTYQRRA